MRNVKLAILLKLCNFKIFYISSISYTESYSPFIIQNIVNISFIAHKYKWEKHGRNESNFSSTDYFV